MNTKTIEPEQAVEVKAEEPKPAYRVCWYGSAPLEDARLMAAQKLGTGEYYLLSPTKRGKKLLSAAEQREWALFIVRLLKNWRVKGRIEELPCSTE
ncbi:MAG: hypothetical protein WC455_11635 [Dehalococcoidia bacterium]|jgi:hypothetical protein